MLLRVTSFKDKSQAEKIEYRMKVHLFGAASYPGRAIFGLHQAAKDGEETWGKEAAEFIPKDFYVDYGIKFVKSSKEAIPFINNSTGMCADAGLRLHKWSSNCR
ncbi:hypothetical protein HOLleu_42724 [Holothuria leucospilota]|uniref:Uncharacterized protein n=1 Tax=Holothuria leucospilota TaxID=206669 RepID=A0A9Q0YEK5_HOLLE|nr:hypothetical protein HOLleu_42724 [Holothuria leucospilota]